MLNYTVFSWCIYTLYHTKKYNWLLWFFNLSFILVNPSLFTNNLPWLNLVNLFELYLLIMQIFLIILRVKHFIFCVNGFGEGF